MSLDARIADLLSDVRAQADVSRDQRIYCNRSIKMEDIEYIGFDMDYTLAQYHQEKLEQLSIELTLQKLIANLNYPEDILTLRYDPAYAIRGLVVDTKLGNVLKMDRHGHVGRVFHGFERLSKEARRKAYRTSRINMSQKRYAWIDTLFGLPEAVMYIVLVDYIDNKSDKKITYKQLYADIRASIDQAHADQSLKTIIKANMELYIASDEYLAEMLHKFRSSGKKTFVLTNSYYLYTDAVMSFLLDDARPNYDSWKSYFDWIIVGGKKPGFFTKNEPFLAIDESTGEAIPKPVKGLDHHKPYQGGNIKQFEDFTGAMGDRVLYVGDHIYGDILRLKKSHVWRTAMVIQELEIENNKSKGMATDMHDLEVLDRRRRNLESEIDYHILILRRIESLRDRNGDQALAEQLEVVSKEYEATVRRLRDRVKLIQQEVYDLEDKIDEAYNPHWGSVIREGRETSRFGKQVHDYADLYTTRVSNFVSYSPLRYFRSGRLKMPHEEY